MTNSNNNKLIKKEIKCLDAAEDRVTQLLAKIEAEGEAAKQIKAAQLKALSIIGYAVDLNFNPIYYIGAVREITGLAENDLNNGQAKWEQLIHPKDLSAFQATRQNLIHSQEAQISEYRIISGDGQIKWLNDRAVPIQDPSGQVIAIEGLLLDVTKSKNIEEELMERKTHLDSILNSVQDVIWSMAPDSFELLYINPAAEKVYGYPPKVLYEDAANGYQLMRNSHEIMLDNFTTLLQRGWFEVEYSITLPNGEKRWLNRRAHFAHDTHGFVARIDGIDADITRRKQAEDALLYISMHDYLTGLYNRFFFEKEIYAIDDASLVSVGLIVCDIDGLKQINDNLGHEAGDQLLMQCSEVLKGCITQDEIVSRIGGDEFTIIIKNCSEDRLIEYVKQLRQAIVDYNQSQPRYPLSLSIGHALKALPDISMREIFRQADNLMYAEKPENRRCFHKLYQTLKL